MERKPELIKVWEYECQCGHTTYFIYGGGADIICHRCWSFGVTYKGKTEVTEDEWRESMHPKLPRRKDGQETRRTPGKKVSDDF